MRANNPCAIGEASNGGVYKEGENIIHVGDIVTRRCASWAHWACSDADIDWLELGGRVIGGGAGRDPGRLYL